MSAPVEPRVRATTLLTIHDGAGSWAIPSAAVTSVERPTTDAPTDVPDALRLLGLEPGEAPSEQRVVVVRADGEQARVLVRGALALTDVTPAELLPLPPELAAAAPLVTHVAVLAGKPALFVVSPGRLLRASRDTAASTLTDLDAARGTSC